MTLPRPLFEAACNAFVQRRQDWVWVERAVPSGVGFMHRTIPLQRRSAASDPSELADDPAAAIPPPDHLICHQSVVLSPTFQVPTFYFSVYDTTGSPVGLSEIMHTSLLREHAMDGMETTAFSIGDPASNFPLLSFGPAVDEMLAAWLDTGSQDPARHVRWLEAWFLVLSCVVDLGG